MVLVGTVMWHGLWILDSVFVPHYQSDHPESEMIDNTVEYLQVHDIPYITYHDGEVLIIEQ